MALYPTGLGRLGKHPTEARCTLLLLAGGKPRVIGEADRRLPPKKTPKKAMIIVTGMIQNQGDRGGTVPPKPLVFLDKAGRRGE